MNWKQRSGLLVGLTLLSLGSSAALIPQAEQWIIGLDPIQAVITQDNDGAFSFQCQTNGKTVVTASKIGFTTSQGDIGPQYHSCKALEQSEELVEYIIPVGRTTSRSATYKTQSFQCQTAEGKEAQLDIRVGRDGCAFRTKVPDGQYEVTAESSTWTFAENGATFLVSILDQFADLVSDHGSYRWTTRKIPHTRANGFKAMSRLGFRARGAL